MAAHAEKLLSPSASRWPAFGVQRVKIRGYSSWDSIAYDGVFDVVTREQWEVVVAGYEIIGARGAHCDVDESKGGYCFIRLSFFIFYLLFFVLLVDFILFFVLTVFPNDRCDTEALQKTSPITFDTSTTTPGERIYRTKQNLYVHKVLLYVKM
jgi:hypothetical protein